MKRSWVIWLMFTGCLAVALVAMGWISLTVVQLEEAEAKARHRALVEENVHLALWRMDSAMAPIVAQESARPYLAYRTFMPADGNHLWTAPRRTDSTPLVPSPLLGEVTPLILVHFQIGPDGQVTSPRTPNETDYKLAMPRHLDEEAFQKAKQALSRIASPTVRDRLVSLLPERKRTPMEVVFAPPANPDDRLAEQRRADLQRLGRGTVEFEQRNRAVLQSISNMVQSQAMNGLPGLSLDVTEIGGVPMTALWLGDNLMLARRVLIGGRPFIQGCLLDWPAIRRWLLESVGDLLPEADLVPSDAAAAGKESRRLAAIPVRLVPGRITVAAEGTASPVWLTLSLAWVGVGVAVAAVAGLLWGVLRLSQRRAAFVSAVTHELRTPLTTFHMYTEMLAEGIITDPQAQREYFRTLRAEASRLSHLVENVLAYARLERGRKNGQVEQLPMAQLLAPIRARLSERANQAGMELVVEGDEAVWATSVRVNPSTLDQILFNLVDNACKYAPNAVDKRIHVLVGLAGTAVEVRVRDHGPGLAQRSTRRLFRPFSKSAHDAANSAPGVGLGLALSKRLARDMGAKLWHDARVADGACFVLRLATADRR